jgi:hypothetical protein
MRLAIVTNRLPFSGSYNLGQPPFQSGMGGLTGYSFPDQKVPAFINPLINLLISKAQIISLY